MENENIIVKQENGKRLNILLIILIIIILVLLSYVIYGKFINNKVKNNENKYIEEKNKNLSKESNIIYTYNYNDKEICFNDTSYEMTVTYCSSRIVLPYINIDSEDVKKVNSEIKQLNDKQYDILNNAINNVGYFDYADVKTDYEYYIYDNILSVVILEYYGGEVPNTYYTYVIDLNTKKLLTYNDVINKTRQSIYNNKKITSSNINEYAKKAINAKMMTFNYSTNSDSEMNKYFTECYNKYVNDTKKYYLNNSGELNIISKLYTGAGMGQCIYEYPINLENVLID